MQSAENSKKLDALTRDTARILQLIEGQDNAPGILGRLSQQEEILQGKNGARGLIAKVDIMWRVYTTFIALLSMIVGWLLKSLATSMHF